MNTYHPTQVNELLQRTPPDSCVYLIGAGGCGMSGLGHLLLDMGYTVAGSDLLSGPEVEQLRGRGATIHQGHSAEHLLACRPVLIVYSSAIHRQNPELQVAEQMQLPIVRRAVLLAALLGRQRGICVAGMHGKTTTSALLTYALENLKANPSYAIGALVPQLRRHARFVAMPAHADGSKPKTFPGPQVFVIEADESDGTLREFAPEHAIILNIDEEHMDYYVSLEGVCSAFGQFATQTRQSVIYCADDARLASLLTGHPNAISYGFAAHADYRLVPRPGLSSMGSLEMANRFELWRAGKKLGDFSLALMGDHNISNAGAVIAMLHQLGYEPVDISWAMAGFRGAARRQQELYRDPEYRVFDDYGHHPAEIEATLLGFKRLGCHRLLVAFQPHRFTRTQILLKQFATCFHEADQLWVTEIYAASEPQISGVNGALLAKAIHDQGQSVTFIPSLDELRLAVRTAMQPGDLVLFLGAGDITKVAHQLVLELKQSQPPSRWPSVDPGQYSRTACQPPSALSDC